jgi:hypothetical protein
MNAKYVFGRQLTNENYSSLKNLAHKLAYNNFKEVTGFGSGIHNRLRRFSTFEEYKAYTSANNLKYYPRSKKRTITLKDVYEKLVEIEKLIKK